MAGSVRVSMTVNGAQESAEVEPRLLLVHFLRETLGLTGTHVGCDTSNCGACTVHLNGEAIKSCTLLAVQADGAEVKTIEGMGQEGALHPLQEAFWEHHGLQCGYCTPGMIMASADLLQRNPNPTEQEVREALAGNLCRCTGYHNIVKAVLAASSVMSAPAADRWVGQAIKRKEDPRLIMGRARYIDDINVTGQLWASFVRSPEAHAKIVSIDTSAAKAYPGVKAVFTGNDVDLESPLPLAWVPPGVEVNNPPHWAIAKDEVHHVGDPVALVIGEDRYAVVDAAEQVLVEYDPLPVVTDPEAALAGGDLVHADTRHEQGARVVARRRRPRGRVRAGRRDRRAARGQPPHRRRGDRAARRARRLPRRLADAHLLDAGPALPAAVPGAPARDQRGPRARDRARGRRRLRLQAADLRRGDRARLGVAQARAADQVDRGPLRGHAGHPPRARPDRDACGSARPATARSPRCHAKILADLGAYRCC